MGTHATVDPVTTALSLPQTDTGSDEESVLAVLALALLLLMALLLVDEGMCVGSAGGSFRMLPIW